MSYDTKHNEANGEGNRDGTDDNRSWNCGVEGPTDDPSVLALRARQRRNLMTTLLLSQGVPMICGGHEIGRTQLGNNNAYCQDSELSWHRWDAVDEAFLEFCSALVSLRRSHPVFRRRRFFDGRPIWGAGLSDIAWLRSDGLEMGGADWQAGSVRTLGVLRNGDALPDPDQRGHALRDDTFLLLFNGSADGVPFVLPTGRWGSLWALELDTANDRPGRLTSAGGDRVEVAGRSVRVLRRI